MFLLLAHVFTQVLLPIVVMFACGWALDRRFRLNLDTIVKLSIHLFVPGDITGPERGVRAEGASEFLDVVL